MSREMRGPLGVSEQVEDPLLLNCDNAHLVALLQYYGVVRPADPMACQWHFHWDGSPVVPATLRIPALEAILRHTGLRFEREELPFPQFHERLTELVRSGTPAMIYGDSFCMPWIPYFEHEHGPHPTIVDAVAANGDHHMVEAYRNRTPWGDCVPVKAVVSSAQFERLVRALHPERGILIALAGKNAPVAPSVREILRANARAVLEHVGERRELLRFSARAREQSTDVTAMNRYDLGCWELTRARSAHAAWLQRLQASEAPEISAELVQRFSTRISEPWQRVSQFAHLAARRVQNGSPPPHVSFDLIDTQLAQAELEHARDLLSELDG